MPPAARPGTILATLAAAMPALGLVACASRAAAPTGDELTAAAMAAATATLTPAPTKSPFPTFTPTPALTAGSQVVVGGELRARSAPNTQAPVVRTLQDLAPVKIDTVVQGENVVVGGQRWLSSYPPWGPLWFRLTDGTFVYSAFIFILQPGEASPLLDPQGKEKWVDVNVSTQRATAMVGDQPVYTALVSTGSPDFPTPLGSHMVEPDGRLAVERMTASQAGYTPGQASYDVQNVFFTQYFDRKGDALHLNYWRPSEVFGRTATSHGCVGLLLHDAQWFWLFGFPGMRVEVHP